MEMGRILAEREDIRYQTKKHWAVFLKAAAYFGLAIVLMWAKAPLQAKAVGFVPPEYLKALSAEDLKAFAPESLRGVKGLGSERQAQPAQDDPRKASPTIEPRTVGNILVHTAVWSVAVVCFAFTLVFAVLGLSRLLCFFSNKVVITPRRVIQQDVLSGSLFSLNLSAVESVRAYTGLLGSVLGYGKVILVTGSGQKIVIANLRRPHEFERELFAAK